MSTFCSAPWTNLHIHPSGAIRPCCIYTGNLGRIGKQNLKEAYFSESADKLRSTITSQSIDPNCIKCFQKEESKVNSYRNVINSQNVISEQNTPQASLDLIESVDLSFSNLCNMSCKFCGPWCSSKWISKLKELPQDDSGIWKNYTGHNWTVFELNAHQAFEFIKDFKNLKLIEIKGGEPFMAPQHLVFLKLLVDSGLAGNISLSYISNGTLLNKDYLELLSHFKKVNIIFSLEGVGPIYQYLRGKKDGDQIIEKAIQFFSPLKNINLRIHYLLCCYNLFQVGIFFDWYLKIYNEYKVPISLGTVVDPTFLDLRRLPKSFRNKALENFPDSSLHPLVKQIHTLITGMDLDEKLSELKEFTEALDKRDNTSLFDIQPEFKDLFAGKYSE